jgi:hypothetical protein
VTPDRGTTWRSHKDGPTGAIIKVEAIDDQTSCYHNHQRAVATIDGGRTWNRLHSELGITDHPYRKPRILRKVPPARTRTGTSGLPLGPHLGHKRMKSERNRPEMLRGVKPQKIHVGAGL